MTKLEARETQPCTVCSGDGLAHGIERFVATKCWACKGTGIEPAPEPDDRKEEGGEMPNSKTKYMAMNREVFPGEDLPPDTQVTPMFWIDRDEGRQWQGWVTIPGSEFKGPFKLDEHGRAVPLNKQPNVEARQVKTILEETIAAQYDEIKILRLQRRDAWAKLREYDELVAKIHELTAVRMLIPDRDIEPVKPADATGECAADSGAIPITLEEFRKQVRWVYPHAAEHETGYRADDDTRNVLIYPGGLVIESKATGFYVELFGESEESADLASLEEKLYQQGIEQGVLKEVQNG